jgi:hypothetical protein
MVGIVQTGEPFLQRQGSIVSLAVLEQMFHLTDTDGADAPKSRSWRFAFLKRRVVPVMLPCR